MSHERKITFPLTHSMLCLLHTFSVREMWKCDMIKQNHSKVYDIQFWVFFMIDLKLHHISYILLKTPSKLDIWVNVGFEKQYKRFVIFDGLYLTINIADKRLI